MQIKLKNTLSGKIEDFLSIKEGIVSMYHCGPTVYNYLHIGNIRAYILADTLRRLFETQGYTVKQVINITDVGHMTGDIDEGEDKVEKMAKTAGKTAAEISAFYTKAFYEDIAEMNIKTEGTLFPFASQHIPEQIALIEELEKGGHTYRIEDGIYFDTSTFEDYGKLGNINIEALKKNAEARVDENTEKRNITDFALWKFSKPEEKRFQEWKSPWGKGFPGWHIECSAMSMKYLGNTFDIHTGGIDHIPVHHNNEIAQSECVSHEPLAHYWLHNAFINVVDGKMSKSKDNFLTLTRLKEEGISAMGYRYWLLTAHYSTQMQFSLEAVQSAETAYNKLISTLAGDTNSVENTDKNKNDEGLDGKMDGKIIKSIVDECTSYLADDLNTSKIIATIWNILKDESINSADAKATILELDKMLGLNIEKNIEIRRNTQDELLKNIPENVKSLLIEREEARNKKEWQLSDDIREKIRALGYDVKDTERGQQLCNIE